MIKKARLLAGLAMGCVLSTTAAMAEEYRGFYFGVWGGSGEVDFPSKAAMDQAITDQLAIEVAAVPIQGRTSLSIGSITGSTLDDSLTPWGVQAGFRFNKYVAAEVGYVDLGELLYRMTGTIGGDYAFVCSCEPPAVQVRTLDGGFERATQLTSAGVTASVLGMMPIGQHFDAHVRGGIYYADTRVTNRFRYVDDVDQSDIFNLLHRRVDASQTELFGGIGAAWNINQGTALRVEYQKFFDVGDDEKSTEGDVDVLNVSILFK